MVPVAMAISYAISYGTSLTKVFIQIWNVNDIPYEILEIFKLVNEIGTGFLRHGKTGKNAWECPEDLHHGWSGFACTADAAR